MTFFSSQNCGYVLLCKANLKRFDPEAYVIHIGTYDLTTDKTPDEICSETWRLIKEFKTDKSKTVVSNIAPRVDTYYRQLKKINALFKEFCEIMLLTRFHIIISIWRNT